MQQFPLYDSLNELALRDTKINLNELNSKIPDLTDDQQEVIAALIYHHSLVERIIIRSKKIAIVYSGKTVSDNKTGVIFTISLLPELLQKIIAVYVNSI
jgi:hypothetical protein